jgi:hypothetical protein
MVKLYGCLVEKEWLYQQRVDLGHPCPTTVRYSTIHCFKYHSHVLSGLLMVRTQMRVSFYTNLNVPHVEPLQGKGF